MVTKEVRKKIGKHNRDKGQQFELRVRKDLENIGWLVSKFQNNVELTELWSAGQKHSTDKPLGYDGKMIPAKRKYNPFQKALAIGTGFPDFICWKTPIEIETRAGIETHPSYDIIGVECKVNGYLDKIERAKCEWLLKHTIFNKILIAKKKKEGRKIIPEYTEFKNKYALNQSEEGICECGHEQWSEHKSTFDPMTAQECNVKGCKCKKFKLKK